MDGFSSGFSINGFEFSVWCSPCSPSGHFVSEEGVGQDHAVFSGKVEEGVTVDVGLLVNLPITFGWVSSLEYEVWALASRAIIVIVLDFFCDIAFWRSA